jgi:hypothetical protein
MLVGGPHLGGFFGCGDVQGAVKSGSVFDLSCGSVFRRACVLGFGLGERERLLGGIDMVQFGLSLVAKEPDELGEGYWFF